MGQAVQPGTAGASGDSGGSAAAAELGFGRAAGEAGCRAAASALQQLSRALPAEAWAWVSVRLKAILLAARPAVQEHI